MNYEEFIEEVRKRILSHLSADYLGADVRISPNNKVNYETHSLSVVRPSENEKEVAVSLDMKMFYERYKKDPDMDALLDRMADSIETASKQIDEDPVLSNPEMKKENIFLQLINTASNEKLLDESPNRPLFDMSKIYRMRMGVSEDGLMSVKITNDLMKSLGLTENDLHELAAKQTLEMFPPKIQSMNEIMLGYMSDAGLGELDGEELMESMDMGVNMLVVSNEYGIQGASLMAFDSVLHDAAERIGDDIFILPSSTHEFLAVSQSMCDPEELQMMVSDINRSTVGEADRLSNQVFAYDRTARELTVAASSVVKGIRNEDYASMVAERSEYSFDMPQPSHAR